MKYLCTNQKNESTGKIDKKDHFINGCKDCPEYIGAICMRHRHWNRCPLPEV
jgi:hypothetical protein